MTVVASSPGKLVLIGEYAVLAGAPALVVAVNRRAEVTLEEVPGSTWTVAAPGLTDVVAAFEVDARGAPRWQDPELASSTFQLVDRLLAALRGAAHHRLPPSPAYAATLDTRRFFAAGDRDRRKLGLGSSAALTVALATALGRLAGDRVDDGDELGRLSRLVSLHRAVQGGRGSGIDIAASLLGGVVRYRLGEDGGVAEAVRCELPTDLLCRWVWTGRAASTGAFLERLDTARASRGPAVDRVLADLASTSERGLEALASGDSARFLAEVDRFVPALEALGQTIDMPVLSADHRQLWKTAADYGTSYKPSGAGGGDFGVALGGDCRALDGFCVEAARLGAVALDLEIDPVGTTVEIR